jgi:HD superfamily phosphodiesterase
VDREEIDRIARAELIDQRGDPNREPGYAYAHGRRTARLAMALIEAAGIEAEKDVVYAAALLHDVAKGLGLGEPHHEIGARLAGEMLREACAPDELAQVCQVIRQHPLRVQPNDYAIETQLVQDADLVDHVGAGYVWRNIYWTATEAKTMDDTLGVYEERAQAGRWDEYRALLNLEAAVKALERRAAFERAFFAQLQREQEGWL